MHIIPNGHRNRAVWIWLTFLLPSTSTFVFLSWMKREVYKRVVDKQDDLLARILDVAAYTRECEEKFWRTKRDLRTRFCKCIEIDGGIFENLL